MQVYLYCVMIAVATVSARIDGIPGYNNFGIHTKRIYAKNDYLRGRDLHLNPGFSSPFAKGYIINNGYYSLPHQRPNFIDLPYSIGYNNEAQYQPVGNDIVLKNIPSSPENSVNSEQLIRLLYQGLGGTQPKVFKIIHDNKVNTPVATTAATYVPESVGNIVQSRNVKFIQEDLTNTFNSVTEPKGSYIKESNPPAVFRVVRNNLDIGDAGSNSAYATAAKEVVYKVLPDSYGHNYERDISKATLDPSIANAADHLKVIKGFVPTPAYTSSYGGEGKLQIINNKIPLNSGELLLDISQNELLKLFSK